MRYAFIVNPVAGKRDAARKLVPVIEETLSAAGVEGTIEYTRCPGDAAVIASALTSDPSPVRIMACGGDGTLSEAAAGLSGASNAALTVFANGSGNDFIKSFPYPRTAFQDVSVIFSPNEVTVDMLSVNDGRCLNIASVGIDADVCASLNKYRKLRFLSGAALYAVSLFECLLKPIGKILEIRAGGRSFSGEYAIVAVGNGRAYGGGFNALPEASLDDGYADIVLVKKTSLPRIARLIGIYKKGNHIRGGEVAEGLEGDIQYFRARDIEISSKTPFVLNHDGEVMTTGDAAIRIEPANLRFILPDNGPESIQK